jgi:hypothetical protein
MNNNRMNKSKDEFYRSLMDLVRSVERRTAGNEENFLSFCDKMHGQLQFFINYMTMPNVTGKIRLDLAKETHRYLLFSLCSYVISQRLSDKKIMDLDSSFYESKLKTRLKKGRE